MRESERESFEEWAQARQQALVRTAFLLTGDFQRAEDLVQEALVRAASDWGKLRNGSPDAWVRTVVYRQHVSWWRSRRREVLVQDVPDRGVENPEFGSLPPELAQLTRGQRAVVLLRFVEDLSVAQTAAVLGVSEGTVKKQTSLALVRLRTLVPNHQEGR